MIVATVRIIMNENNMDIKQWIDLTQSIVILCISIILIIKVNNE